MLLLFIISLIVLVLSPFVFSSPNKKLEKIYKWGRKYIGKYENAFRYIYHFIQWTFIIYFIYLFNKNYDAHSRFLLSLNFIFTAVLINHFPLSFYFFLIFPYEFPGKFYLFIKKVFRNKKRNAKVKSQKPLGEKFSKKFFDLVRFRFNTLLLYSTVLLSFSLDLVLDLSNYWIIATLIGLVIILYLILAIINIFRTQKDLIFLSDRLEASAEFLDAIKSNHIFIFFKKTLISLLKNLSFSSKNGNIFDSLITGLKKNIHKIQFLTKMGVAVFRSVLTMKLLIIVFNTLIFYIIVISNYLITLENNKIISSGFKTYSQFLLHSFYLFIGESVTMNSIDLSFFSAFTLFLAISGWLLSVTYIVLYFDIMNLSATDFNNAVNKSILTLHNEITSTLEEMKNESPNPILDSLINMFKNGQKVEGLDPDMLEKFKNEFDNLITPKDKSTKS